MEEKTKNMLVLLLAAGVILLAFYFATLGPKFERGEETDSEAFAGILSDATRVHIVMDLRNAADGENRRGIMQCGIDFAGSMGLATKEVDYLSFDSEAGEMPLVREDFCIHSEEGRLSAEECFEMINSEGITIYIRQGSLTKYYTRGMVVGIGSDYQLDSCSITEK